MKARLFSLTAILGAFGAGLCCIGPVVFSLVGLSSFASLWLLQHVVPYRNWWFALTFVALGLGFVSAWRRRGRMSWWEWAMFGGSTLAVIGLLGYTIWLEGPPRWIWG